MAQGNVLEYDVSSWGEKKPEKGEGSPETEHGGPFGRAFNAKGAAWWTLFSSSRAVSARAASIMEVL